MNGSRSTGHHGPLHLCHSLTEDDNLRLIVKGFTFPEVCHRDSVTPQGQLHFALEYRTVVVVTTRTERRPVDDPVLPLHTSVSYGPGRVGTVGLVLVRLYCVDCGI